MKLALILAALSAAILIPLAIRRFKQAQAAFDAIVKPHEPITKPLDTIIDLGTADDLAFDEAEHVKALAPKLVFVPDGFTCLGCHETDALPDSVWCAVCSERVASFPSEPIERGQR